MSEMSFEQMLEESLKTIRNGEVVEGTVIGVKPDEIILNIGYKSDGIITRNEYTNESNVDLTTLVKVGDNMEAKVLKVNDGEGQVTLTYKRLAAEKGSNSMRPTRPANDWLMPDTRSNWVEPVRMKSPMWPRSSTRPCSHDSRCGQRCTSSRMAPDSNRFKNARGSRSANSCSSGFSSDT